MIRSLILILYSGALALLALRSLRGHRLKERYVLLFLSVGFPFLALAVWPHALAKIGELTNMPYHTVMILCLTGFLLIIFFELLSIVSVQERQLATLAQMVSILSEEQRCRAGPRGGAADEASGAATENAPDDADALRQEDRVRPE